MSVIFSIAKNNFNENLRGNLFFIIIAVALCLIGLFPLLTLFVFNEQNKMIIDSAMAITLFLGLVLSVISANNSFYTDMSSGTILLLMSKPVHRSHFVIGKMIGIILVLTFFVIACLAGTFASLTISLSQFEINYTALICYYSAIGIGIIFGGIMNYWRGSSFSGAASKGILFLFILLAIQSYFYPLGMKGVDAKILQIKIIPAFILVCFAIWVFGVLSSVFATRLNFMLNFMIIIPIYCLGLISNYLFYDSITTSLWSKFFYLIIPNWQFFWLVDIITTDKTIPYAYIFWTFVYAIAYIVVCTSIAILLFDKRETGQQEG